MALVAWNERLGTNPMELKLYLTDRKGRFFNTDVDDFITPSKTHLPSALTLREWTYIKGGSLYQALTASDVLTPDHVYYSTDKTVIHEDINPTVQFVFAHISND